MQSIQRIIVKESEIIGLFILGWSVKKISDYVQQNEKYSKEVARAKTERAIIDYIRKENKQNSTPKHSLPYGNR